MKKNLIVIHLESVSNQTYYQEIHQMPFLERMMKESINFSNFFTTATSSVMAFTDFCYGNDFELDLSPNVDKDLKFSNNERNLFEILDSVGYAVKGIAYPETWRDDLNNNSIWNLSEKYDYSSTNENEFYNKIKTFIKETKESNKPIAMHVWDIRSHIFYMDEEKLSKSNFQEKKSYGFKAIDNTFRYIYELLEDEQLLNNTLIVAYGDHGDELWSHNLNGGFCHAIEPYTSLVHTPCLLIDSDIVPELNKSLTSLIDLKWTILGLLNINYTPSFNSIGINILEESREYCFSKNLLANQVAKVNSVLRKSYSVSNTSYHLIVTSFGLELYLYKIDPANTFNLLNLFAMNDSGELIEFDNRGAWHSHFKKIMSESQQQDIMNNFKQLYASLYNFVENKNQYIHQNGGGNSFKLLNFKKIKQQGNYQWNA